MSMARQELGRPGRPPQVPTGSRQACSVSRLAPIGLWQALSPLRRSTPPLS